MWKLSNVKRSKKSLILVLVFVSVLLIFSASSFAYTVNATFSQGYLNTLWYDDGHNVWCQFSNNSASFPSYPVRVGQNFTIIATTPHKVACWNGWTHNAQVNVSVYGNGVSASLLNQYYDYSKRAFVFNYRLNSIYNNQTIFYANVKWYANVYSMNTGAYRETKYIGQATGSIRVIPPNNAPWASGKTISINEDTSSGWRYLNCGDADGDALKMVVGNSYLPGSFKTNGATAYTFTPKANWNGTAWFDFYVYDPKGANSGWKREYIKVNAVNDKPSVSNISRNGEEDYPVSFAKNNFAAVFSDVDGQALNNIKITELPANGLLKLNGSNIAVNKVIAAGDISKLKFVPNANWYGNTSFKWAASDGVVYSNIALCSISIGSVNDIPTVSNISKNGTEDTAVTFSANNFTAVYNDVEGQALNKIKITSLPANGVLSLNGTNITVNTEVATASIAGIKFTPNANWNGNTSFSWKASDGSAYSSAATCTLSLSAVNDKPVVENVKIFGTEDIVTTFAKSDFEGGFIDVDNDALNKITITSLPIHGTLTFDGANVIVSKEIAASDISKLKFTPDANWHGTTSFYWKGTDGTVYSDTAAKCLLTIKSVNDLPTLKDKTLTQTFKGVEKIFMKIWFDSCYSDVDGDALAKVKITELPIVGQIKLNGNALSVGDEVDANKLDNLRYVTSTNDVIPSEAIVLKWKAFDGSEYSTEESVFNIPLIEITADVS